MITRVLAALLVTACLTAVPVAPTSAGGPTVSVADMRFTPATLTVALGATVTWSFPDAMAHTTTSTQGFWNSGPRAGGLSFQVTFESAGSYPYQCTIHPTMRGKVLVPVVRSASKLRWAASAGDTYDVQVRKGKGGWKAFRTGTAAVSARFAKKGTWSVRARTHADGNTSGWSPVLKVKTA